jgi:hypothetical protein
MMHCARITNVAIAVVLSGIMGIAAPAVNLTVMNPRGEIAPLLVAAPNPRISDLTGKKIGLYWNGKASMLPPRTRRKKSGAPPLPNRADNLVRRAATCWPLLSRANGIA